MNDEYIDNRDMEIQELKEEIEKMKGYIKELSAGLGEALADIRDLKRRR